MKGGDVGERVEIWGLKIFVGSGRGGLFEIVVCGLGRMFWSFQV
jgi:hypothetical protein